MRAPLLAVILVAAAGTSAAADRFAPAADMSFGVAGPSDSLSRDYSTPYLRFAGGIQRGRWAVLLHVDGTTVEPQDESLDSDNLNIYGKGAALRVELRPRKSSYLHLSAGASWRRFKGDGEVRRGCSTFGGCDAGFYREVPEYTSTTPWLALAFGARTKSRIWPGVGGELGLAPITIDRSGTAPDTHGVVVWFGLNVTLGGD